MNTREEGKSDPIGESNGKEVIELYIDLCHN